MANTDSDNIFDALAIRSTATQTSSISNSKTFLPKTVAVINGLDQQVTIQVQGSDDQNFTNVFNVGSSFNVSANSNSYQTADVYFPYIRATAVCSVAPTTGSLTVILFKVI